MSVCTCLCHSVFVRPFLNLYTELTFRLIQTVYYSMFSLFVLAFLHQTPSWAEQTSALLKDKAGNIVLLFFISLLSTKTNNAIF